MLNSPYHLLKVKLGVVNVCQVAPLCTINMINFDSTDVFRIKLAFKCAKIMEISSGVLKTLAEDEPSNSGLTFYWTICRFSHRKRPPLEVRYWTVTHKLAYYPQKTNTAPTVVFKL